MALGVGNYGSRHAGTGSWLLVRVTAVLIAIGLLAVVVLLAQMPSFGYKAWQGLWGKLEVRLLLSAWLVALTLHSYLGCDAILKDYAHTPGLRLTGMVVVAGVLLTVMVYGFAVFFAWH